MVFKAAKALLNTLMRSRSLSLAVLRTGGLEEEDEDEVQELVAVEPATPTREDGKPEEDKDIGTTEALLLDLEVIK